MTIERMVNCRTEHVKGGRIGFPPKDVHVPGGALCIQNGCFDGFWHIQLSWNYATLMICAHEHSHQSIEDAPTDPESFPPNWRFRYVNTCEYERHARQEESGLLMWNDTQNETASNRGCKARVLQHTVNAEVGKF